MAKSSSGRPLGDNSWLGLALHYFQTVPCHPEDMSAAGAPNIESLGEEPRSHQKENNGGVVRHRTSRQSCLYSICFLRTPREGSGCNPNSVTRSPTACHGRRRKGRIHRSCAGHPGSPGCHRWFRVVVGGPFGRRRWMGIARFRFKSGGAWVPGTSSVGARGLLVFGASSFLGDSSG